MTPLLCETFCVADSPHLQQIYTGLWQLERAGKIILSQRCRGPWPHFVSPSYLHKRHGSHLFVRLAERRRLLFDVHDGYDVDEDIACQVDFYFKRSYSADRIPKELRHVVYPLGFNYEVYPPVVTNRAISRSWRLGRTRSATLKKLTKLGLRKVGLAVLDPDLRPTSSDIVADPDPTQEPRVLFMVGAWDPEHVRHRSMAEVEQRREINRMRGACIRELRKELGSLFTGGFIHTEYTKRTFPALLMNDPGASDKVEYLDRVKQHSVCVATTGLHGSVGWKFAEYVAMSRAIVSEPLQAEVPGPFARDRNYLEFGTPEECVNQAVRLMEDRTLRKEMMHRNAEYYNRFLRPDIVVGRALERALNGA